MDYIILAIAFYCIILNCMAITLTRTVKTQQRPIRPQNAQAERIVLNATKCRACNVLMVEHNHGCKWDDLKQVAITPDTQADTQINIKGDVQTMNDTELLERYNAIVNEIKQRPELSHILKPKRKAKTAPDAEILEDWLQDSFPGYKGGRNKLGGGNCHVSTFTLKQANIDRINTRFAEVWGTMPEREQLVSKCPKCNGHFRTSFERDMSLIEEDKEYQGRIIHKLVTTFTCDNCAHTQVGECGSYLVHANYDAVANVKPEPIPCPLSIAEIQENNADDIADEPINGLLECPGCKQEFEADELDNDGCPFCGCPIMVTV